jgi:hypothetical protein
MDIHTMISEYYMWRAVEKDDKGVKKMGKRGRTRVRGYHLRGGPRAAGNGEADDGE